MPEEYFVCFCEAFAYGDENHEAFAWRAGGGTPQCHAVCNVKFLTSVLGTTKLYEQGQNHSLDFKRNNAMNIIHSVINECQL